MPDPKTTRIIGRGPPWARWLNIVMGAWLFASAWVWPMPDPARGNAMIVGILITAVAFVAIFMPAARFLNTLLAAWLLVSTAFLFTGAPSYAMWNNVVVALAVMLVSLARDSEPKSQEYVERWARHRAR